MKDEKLSRVFMSDEGYYVDRTKPVRQDEPLDAPPELFEECDPCEVIDDLEARVEELEEMIEGKPMTVVVEMKDGMFPLAKIPVLR